MAKKKRKLKTGRIVLIAVVIVVFVAIVYGFMNLDKLFPEKGTEEQEVTEGEVVARVNGDPIYASELDKRLKMYQAQFGPQMTRDFVLNQTINEVLLLQESKKQGIIVDEEKIQEGLDAWFLELEQQVPEEQLSAILSAQNLTLEEFKKDTEDTYRKNFLIFELLNRTVFSKIDDSQYQADTSVTEQEIEEYYNANQEMYDRIDASHILICYEGASQCTANRTREEAEQLMSEVQTQLMNNGDFEELAIEFSDGPSGPQGGNLGEFSRGQMVGAFESAAFALKYPNQLSDIVETDFGFHIIKLNSKKNQLEDFATEIRFQLQLEKQQESQSMVQQVQQEELEKYISGLRAEAEIKIITANPNLAKDITPQPGIQTFSEKQGEVCTEDGKPIIRLFSTTRCPHCTWITETFDSTMKEYVSKGDIVAYHWELDTEDNTLTDFVEDFMPQTEKNVYREFNPMATVPTFIFGCKYYRVGTGYESDNDLAAEKREFVAVIEALLDN